MTEEDIENLFRYHPPTTEKQTKHGAVDDLLRETAKKLLALTPHSAEQTLAIRALHMARYHANTAIACRS